MTNNNWIETMKTIGKISSIHPEIVDEFILITKDLLIEKDQEHKAELEMIKGELKEYFEGLIHVPNPQLTGNNIISILDSHINNLTQPKELYEETIQIITRRK